MSILGISILGASKSNNPLDYTVGELLEEEAYMSIVGATVSKSNLISGVVGATVGLGTVVASGSLYPSVDNKDFRYLLQI